MNSNDRAGSTSSSAIVRGKWWVIKQLHHFLNMDMLLHIYWIWFLYGPSSGSLSTLSSLFKLLILSISLVSQALA